MSVVHAVRQRWRDLSFAHKLALLLIALVSLPIVFVGAYNTRVSRDALVVSARARDLERARGTVESIEAFFAEARADVKTVSRLPGIIELCAGQQVPQVQDRARYALLAAQAEQGFVALYVTDRAGRVLAATDDRAPLGSYETGRVFLGAIAGETVVDDPAYEPFDRTVVIKVANAVHSQTGEIIGTATGLVAVTALDRFSRRDDNYAGHGEFSVLWTAAGVRLSDSRDSAARFTAWAPLPAESTLAIRQRLGPAYPDHSQVDPGFAEIPALGAWLLYDPTSSPHRRLASTRDGPLHVTVVPLQGERWLYGIFVPERQLMASLQNEILRDWGVAFFTVLSALALSVIAARWVTRPLRRVTDAAHALESGVMTERVTLDQRDEFGQLGSAFDRMATTLAAHEHELQRHAADLERRVEERTATLQLFERASRALATSIEMRRTAGNLAALLVPDLADFCAIDVRDDHGAVRRVGCRHADAALEREANQLPDLRPVSTPVETLSPEQRSALGITDLRVYELAAGRQFVGYLTIAMATSGRRFAGDAEGVFEELGRRAGLAMANALLYQDAQEANRLKDDFLGVVSHELRTPLNAILGWTRLAAVASEAGVDRQKALDAVDRNARALARLVDDLLDVPRIMTGKLALDVRPVDIVAIVNTAIDAIRPSAEAKGVRLVLESELPSAPLDGDAQRLQQVFANLLANAIKFTPRGGQITARISRDDTQCTIVVSDNGAGIPPAFLPFVFDRFRQADSSTSRAHGGLGIGLSIVRHLVDMHGGQVSAASDGAGKGSRFTVRLPFTYHATAEPSEEPGAATDALVLAQLRDLKLLVLDDEIDSREVIATLLQSAGASVTAASTVSEALQILTRAPGQFGAVLADIGMPGEDGFAFIAGVRAARDARIRTLPVIAVTAYASRGDRARALAAGFDFHVAKPVSLNALAEALSASAVLRGR